MQDNENKEANIESETVLNDELDLLKAELTDLEDRLLRAIAESQNIRKAAEKEKADVLKYSISKFARDVLSIRDNLKLALSNCDSSDAVMDGIKLTLAALDKALTANGITIINAMNSEFDPHFHQAVVEIEDEKKHGVVVQVMQDGFMINERLLRPALVGVAKKKCN